MSVRQVSTGPCAELKEHLAIRHIARGAWRLNCIGEFNGEMTLSAAERRLLAGMPLHAITSVHGEAGLRERLAIEIAGFAAGERARVEEALGLASRLHAGDRRQREPYVNHLLRVAVRILSHYRVSDQCRCLSAANYPFAGLQPWVHDARYASVDRVI